MGFVASNLPIRNIVITNPWSEKAKGDLGILCGTIEMLQKIYPSAKIFVLRMLSDQEPQSNLITVEKLYRIQQVSSVTPLRIPSNTQKLKSDIDVKLKRFLILLENLMGISLAHFSVKFAHILPDCTWRETLDILSNADLVVTRGGGYLHSPNLFTDFQNLIPTTFTLWLAKVLKRPIGLIGQTIWNLDGPLAKRIVLPLITSSLLTTCREYESYNYLKIKNFPMNKIRVAPCPSFAMARFTNENEIGDKILEKEGLLNISRPLVGMSIRWHSFGGDPSGQKLLLYLTKMATLARYLADRYGALTVIVPQNLSPGTLIDADSLINEIFEEITEKSYVKIVETEYSPQELIAFYSRFEIFIGTRLHACIFAARGGTFPIAISYAPHKTSGVMQMLGLSSWVLDIHTMSLEEMINKVDSAWQNREKLSEQLKETVQKLEKEAWNNILWLDQALQKVKRKD